MLVSHASSKLTLKPHLHDAQFLNLKIIEIEDTHFILVGRTRLYKKLESNYDTSHNLG